MNIASIRPNPALYVLIALTLMNIISCVSPSAPYRLLSDEVISTIKSPPYSEEQVQHAQSTLRRRISARLSETAIQSELKSFACLIVSQSLDKMTARGELAPSEIPCSYNPQQRCPHRCKRSRLPRSFRLPVEYTSVAQRHDHILWDELSALSDSGANTQWERYLTDCLSCQRASEVKRMVCLRDVGGVELTAERTEHKALDRWLNQCSSLRDPEVKALITYRAHMLTPSEDLSYPLKVDSLTEELQERLTTRAMIGEAMRLLRGSLDGERIAALLKTELAQSSANESWLKLKEHLRRRLDAPLMPCLEHGLETCTVTGQITLARDQAPRYLEECTLCEHRDVVETWRSGINLGLEPVWRSHQSKSTQALVRHRSPSSLIINEDHTLTRLSLSSPQDRLKWRQKLQSTDHQSSNKRNLHLWSPRFKMISSPQEAGYPLILSSNHRALYGVDPDSGELRWTHRYPFTRDGKLVPCLTIDPLPSGLLSGPLSNGGAICYKKSATHLLNHLGELSLKLTCPDPRGCGSLIALRKLNKSPLNSEAFLLMSHPSVKGNGVTLTKYNLSELSLLQEIESREPTAVNQLNGVWLSSQVMTAPLDDSGESAVFFVGVKKDRRKLSLHLIDLKSNQELWRASLSGLSLVHRPSLTIDQTTNMPLLGVLTDRNFTAYRIDQGERIYNEKLALRNRTPSQRAITASRALSWQSIGETLIVLHPLNRRLYVKDSSKPLSRRSIQIDTLSADASLSSIDTQWVISSPSEGKVYGVPPLLDQVIWTWEIQPYKQLNLSRDWALFVHPEGASLYRVIPKSLDEIARSRPPAEPLSPCALGDRWDCLISGDQVLGINTEDKDRSRSQSLVQWFQLMTQARSFEEAQLSKMDAMMTQGSWAVACQWGLPQACTRMGMFAELGFYSRSPGELPTGVPALRTAYQYYEHAAQQGDPLGSERSAVLLERGQGIPQDYVKARRSYFEACEAGYPYSCARWGFLNELGLGGAIKLTTAITAYQRACKEGSKWSCDRLNQDKLRQLY